MHYLYGNSDRCQASVRCMEGVRISEGPLWEVPLYIYTCVYGLSNYECYCLSGYIIIIIMCLGMAAMCIELRWLCVSGLSGCVCLTGHVCYASVAMINVGFGGLLYMASVVMMCVSFDPRPPSEGVKAWYRLFVHVPNYPYIF